MKKVLLLGGTGFLGSWLAEFLSRDAGIETVVVGRRAPPPGGAGRIRYLQADLFDDTPFDSMFEGVDTCLHLATDQVPATAEGAAYDGFHRNLRLSARVADACSANGVKRLVFASSGGTVYGRNVEGAMETQACAPIGLYGTQKLASEAMLRSRLRDTACRLVILRVANPYGAGQESQRAHGVIGRILSCLTTGREFTVWGDGTQVRDYVYMGDVVEAFASAMTYGGSHDLFNVGSGIGLSTDQMIEACERVVGCRLQVSYSAHPPYDVDRISLDVQRASSELGWQARTNLQSGLRHYFSQLTEKR